MAWDGYPERKWAGYPLAFWLGLIAYLLTGFAVGYALKTAELPSGQRLLLGLLPVLPLLLMGSGLIRMLRHQDELYRRIQLLAVSTAAGIVVIISFTLGMLEEFNVVPRVSANWAGQVMILVWAIAAGVLGRRYR
jgi:hypothetical protein